MVLIFLETIGHCTFQFLSYTTLQIFRAHYTDENMKVFLYAFLLKWIKWYNQLIILGMCSILWDLIQCSEGKNILISKTSKKHGV